MFSKPISYLRLVSQHEGSHSQTSSMEDHGHSSSQMNKTTHGSGHSDSGHGSTGHGHSALPPNRLPGGLIGTTIPTLFHSNRVSTCNLSPANCAYIQNKWRHWYDADRVYGQGTVSFMCAIIGSFILFNLLSRSFNYKPSRKSRLAKSGIVIRGRAVFRYLKYKPITVVGPLGRAHPPLGALILLAVGTAFFLGLSLGPKPYYWPETPGVSFGNSPPLATRSGWMALGLLPFVLAFSSKANIVSTLTGISYEKLQIWHQWTSYAMFVLALMHTFPFIVLGHSKGTNGDSFRTGVYYWTGIAALIAQAFLTFGSLTPLRNKFYETFKLLHILASVVFFVFFFFHCNFRLSSWNYFVTAGVIYLSCVAYSQIRTYFGFGISHNAYSELLPCGMLKTNVVLKAEDRAQSPIPLGAKWNPAQHIFVRFPSLGSHAVTSHPFTICSLPPPKILGGNSQMTLYIKPETGTTERLASFAQKNPNKAMSVLLEGPYGGLPFTTLAKFDKGLIVVGGSGSGYALPIIEDVFRRQHIPSQLNSTVADLEKVKRKTNLLVVMTTSSGSQARWFADEIIKLVWRHAVAAGNKIPDIVCEIHLTGDGVLESRPSSVAGGTSSAAAEKQEASEVPIVPVNVDETPKTEAESLVCQTSDLLSNEITDPPAKESTVPLTQVDLQHLIRSVSGRPDIAKIVQEATSCGLKEEDDCDETVGIAGCGPASLLIDLKSAAAAAQTKVMSGRGSGRIRLVNLHTEQFSW